MQKGASATTKAGQQAVGSVVHGTQATLGSVQRASSGALHKSQHALQLAWLKVKVWPADYAASGAETTCSCFRLTLQGMPCLLGLIS